MKSGSDQDTTLDKVIERCAADLRLDGGASHRPIGARESVLCTLDPFIANRDASASRYGLHDPPGSRIATDRVARHSVAGNTRLGETNYDGGASRVGDTSHDEAALVNQHPH